MTHAILPGCTVMAERDRVTQLLTQMRAGDKQASAQLVPLVYKELRKIAGAMMRRERPGHTLQPTAVVNEAFIRLLDGEQPHFENRAHFFAIAARAMRRVLVDHARRRLADKRGGEAQQQVELDEDLVLPPHQSEEVLDLDRALDRLERLDARQAQIVEMHYFAGNSVAEIAHVLHVSERTVKRELLTARLFLKHQLQSAG
jgi:RNA polymerase sigma-70 factor, ECF subfamily